MADNSSPLCQACAARTIWASSSVSPSTSATSWNDSHPRIDQRRSTAQALMARTVRRGAALVTEAARSGAASETANDTARPSLSATA